ncbi:hypothetical protein OF846_002347 [Rhodotorula toruloides]|nr:hypothetical protein OF846_002347 [Rhodotorula toruloides]
MTSLLPSELLRNIFLHELSEEAGYDWWAEANGRHFSLVCRDWAGPGQELAFYRPTLRGYYPKDPIALFAKHLERFPHIAKLVRDLRLNFSTNKPANADAVRSILQRCNRITQIRWLSNLDLLTADPHVLPLAKLTDVRLGGSKQRCDISALLVKHVFYQHVLLRVCPEALTTLSLTLHESNFDTLSRWVERCTNLHNLEFCLVEADPTDFDVELTSMVSQLLHLRTLKLIREAERWATWDGDNYRRIWGLDELAAELSDFFNTLPPTLVELTAEVWAPAGECYDLVKTFLRTHLHDSLLEAVTFDAEVKKLEATRSQQVEEDSTEATWCLSYKHWEGCSCGDWDYGSWTLDGPDAAEYEVSDPSVELDW